MMPSTIPAMLIGLIIYYFLGLGYGYGVLDNNSSGDLHAAIGDTFVLGWYLLIPALVVIAAALMQFPPLPSMIAGFAAAVILAIAVQGASTEALLGVLMYGYRSDTGIEFVDQLLTKGGLNSMLWVIGLLLLASALGGLLVKLRVIETLIDSLLRVAVGIKSTVVSSTLVMLASTITLDSTMAFILTARVFCPITRGRGYSSTSVSRVLENSGTLIVPLVRWSPAGVFASSNLGVPTLLYAPFAFGCWLAPVFDVLWALLGVFQSKATDADRQKGVEEGRKIAIDGKVLPAWQWLDTEDGQIWTTARA